MKNDKKLYEKLHNSLNKFIIFAEKNYSNNDLLSLLNSGIIDNQNNINLKASVFKDLLKNDTNKKKETNLIDGIINERVNLNRKSLNKKYNSKTYKLINDSDKNNIKKKLILINKEKETFITKINDIEKKNKIDENNKIDSFGKSLNDYFIKDINDEMIKKGIIIKKEIPDKIEFKNERPLKNNYNNLDYHMKMFNQHILKKFNLYINEYKESQKKTLRNVSQKLADKKEKMTNLIPFYIKGYKRQNKDVFHSRKIYDMTYQNRYEKPLINLEDILQNKNQYSEYNFKTGKIPFYKFLRTVNNPYKNLKKITKRPNSGVIFLQFNRYEK